MTTRNFKSYNFVTGAVDGTLAYDFSQPAYIPREEVWQTPQPVPEVRQMPWAREEVRERVQNVVYSRQGFSPLAILGVVAVVFLLVMTLFAQIKLVNISQSSANLEAQISELKAERDKLTIEYETIFNLKDVEEYAVGSLGMQEPHDDQIYYLTGVTSADKAVIVTDAGADFLSLGVEDLLASLRSYFN